MTSKLAYRRIVTLSAAIMRIWPHDGDSLEHRAEEASGESEHDAISRTNAGLGHRTAFSARRAARERKAERSAARTVLKTSMNLAEQDLARAISRKIPDKSTANLTWYRIFAAHRQSQHRKFPFSSPFPENAVAPYRLS